MLRLSVSQQYNDSNYFTFKSTGVRVYSFEEALYHVYHFWRESLDDFLCDEIITWVSELGLSFIASKMKELTKEKHLQILDFLGLVDYFSAQELDTLKQTLQKWELRNEWEKLKERADFLVSRGEPIKALPLYKRALKYEENAALLNNIAIACMQLSAPKVAVSYLARAKTIEPDNQDILLHYVEAAILNHQYENAEAVLLTLPDSADVLFLRGLMAFEQKNYVKALSFYEKAAEANPKLPYYKYKAADVLGLRLRQFDKALQTLQTIDVKDAPYYVKEAEIHSAAGDVPASLKCMRKATEAGENSATLWAKLAEYYRKDYDWRRAEKAITHAVTLAPDNDLVRLERARIKKGLGRTRDYQTELADLLKSFKTRYRGEV